MFDDIDPDKTEEEVEKADIELLNSLYNDIRIIKRIKSMKAVILEKCSKMPDKTMSEWYDKIEDNPNKLTEEQAEQFAKDLVSIECMSFFKMTRKQLLIHLAQEHFFKEGRYLDYNKMEKIEEEQDNG